MDRSNSERRSSIVSELLLRAADGMPEANRDEPFARLLTRILENVGSRIRVTLENSEGFQEQSFSEALRGAEPDSTLSVHLKRPDSSTWFMLSNMFASDEVFWAPVPYEPVEHLYFPVALAATNVREGIRNALGSEAAYAASEAQGMLVAERQKLLEAHPRLKDKNVNAPADEALDLFSHTAFPFDWLKKTEGSKGNFRGAARSARALARLASSTPAAGIHAALHLKNSTRMHQALAAQNAVTQGLLTLREVDDITDREYFESLRNKTREAVYKRHFIDGLERVEKTTGEEADEKRASLAKATWISRVTPLDADDPAKQLLPELFKLELSEAEAFVRADCEAGWKRVPKHEQDTAKAFLAATDFLKQPPDETPHMLRDAIDVRRCRDEIEGAKRLHQPELLGAKQYEIAARVLAAVLRFPHSHPSSDLTDPDPGCCTPAYVREKKKVNCFTGPWLAAAMLLECGFDEECIFYCDVQGTSGGTFGTHGSLLLALDSGQQVLLDVGFHKLRNVPIALYDNATRKKLRFMIDAEESNEMHPRLSPALARLPSDTALRTGIHPRMAVMPMRQGFAWGTLLTTGMDSLETGAVADARHAFELAHAIHPASPDVLVGLARCSVAEGESETAAALLDDAIRRCPDHKMARYQRALLCISAKQYGRARTHLDHALDESATWFAGRAYVEHARVLSAKLNDIFHHETSMMMLESEDFEGVARIRLPDIEKVIDSLKRSVTTTEQETKDGTGSAENPRGTGSGEA